MPTDFNVTDATLHRLRECLINHRYQNARAIIDAMEEQADRRDDFEGYESSDELPVSMLRIPTAVANALDEAGVVTLAELFSTPVHVLAELPRRHLNVANIEEARSTAVDLAKRFDEWRRKAGGGALGPTSNHGAGFPTPILRPRDTVRPSGEQED